MAKKKKSRLKKLQGILNIADGTTWCYVNVDNEFNYNDKKFVISNKVEEYKVLNKAGDVDDFTNEAIMEDVLVVVDKNNNMTFYNQNYDLIDNKYVKEMQ